MKRLVPRVSTSVWKRQRRKFTLAAQPLTQAFKLSSLKKSPRNLKVFPESSLCYLIPILTLSTSNMEETSTLMEQSSLDPHLYNTGEIKEEDETLVDKDKGIPLTIIRAEETLDLHKIIHPNKDHKDILPNRTMVKHRKDIHPNKTIHPHVTLIKYHRVTPNSKPLVLLHHNRVLGHQDKVMRRNRTLDHQGKEKEEIMCHNRTSDDQGKKKEEILRHNRTSDHQGKKKEEILRHNRTSDHQDKEKEEILCHSRTSDKQDKEKEEILSHNRLSDHQDKEREETPCLVKVDGISNRHIWRILNRLTKGIITPKNSRVPDKYFRLLARAILPDREDYDHNLSPFGGLYRTYQIFFSKLIECPCQWGQKLNLLSCHCIIFPCSVVITKMDVVCKAFTSRLLVCLNMFAMVYVECLFLSLMINRLNMVLFSLVLLTLSLVLLRLTIQFSISTCKLLSCYYYVFLLPFKLCFYFVYNEL